MALQMIDFKCPECGHEFEDLAYPEKLGSTEVDPEPCPKCGADAQMDLEIAKRVHRKGNRYRDVSWSTWSVS